MSSFQSFISPKLTRPSFVLGMAFFMVAILLSMVVQPAGAQTSDWQYVTILPQSGNWNYPGYFLLTTDRQVTVSWEIKCTEGDCEGREAEFVYDFTFGPGETITVGWGHQCYRWQFDPINWPHGYIAEPECAEPTATPTVPTAEVTATATSTDTVVTTPTSTGTVITTPPTTPETATPTSTNTLVTTTPSTPGTATPTSTGTLITTPPSTPATATPTSTGTIVTTPPATPGTETSTPEPTGSPTPSTPNQSPPETPRSQLIAVTGADLSTSSNLLPRIFVSLGIVLSGLGLIKFGITGKSKRQ